MRFNALLLSTLALATIGACTTVPSAQEQLEAANLEKAIWCMNVIEVELDLETAGRECIADGYIQHSQHVPDGKDGFLAYFAGRIEKFPEMHADVKRAAADGDLVWLHVHFKAEPDSGGNAVIHIFRMEDGKFAEHWGASQPVPENSQHGNSMF
jgi:predicted SnoaL-like aldol condensation-catalyzing enzyme